MKIITSTTDPTTSNKSPESYIQNGDIWHNTTNDRLWVCVDAGAGTWKRNDTTKTKRVTVDASGGGTGETQTLLTLPAGAIIHEIVAHAEVAMDGDTTTTLEVGVAGNADKYIDSSDFDPSSLNDAQAMTGGGSNDQGTAEYLIASTAIIATWTNTASASAGTVEVLITYTDVMS